MLGAWSSQFNKNKPTNSKQNYDHNSNYNSSNFNQTNYNNKRDPKFDKARSNVVVLHGANRARGKCKEISPVSGGREPDNIKVDTSKPVPVVSGRQEPNKTKLDTLKTAIEPEKLPSSNFERFLEAITPSVHVKFLHKPKIRRMRSGDVEFQPYFVLNDLWESFKEWSAYGAGVPLILNNDSDSIVQYYVPSLSGIQIYVHPSTFPVTPSIARSEKDKVSTYSGLQLKPSSLPSDICSKLEGLLLKDPNTKLREGSTSDGGEYKTIQESLLFEYLEQISPYSREPLADKISDLALQVPELKTVRSSDLLSSSWLSVAWYPIYRIPYGPAVNACFLTYHSLHTPVEDAAVVQAPRVINPTEIGDIPRISLPVFGLSAFKFIDSQWISNIERDHQLMKSLFQAADNWLSLLQVYHPDYYFFRRQR